MSLDARFAKALGREPTRAERERLERLKSAFDVDDNDALWTIVVALEYYDARYRSYPSEVARLVRKGFRELGSSPPLPASVRAGSEAGGEVRRVSLAALALAFCVLLGAVCLTAGVSLSSGGPPPWTLDAGESSRFAIVVNAVLNAPAGWIAVLTLVVPGAHAADWGVKRIRSELSDSRSRLVGWLALCALFAAVAGWLALLVA